jgi:hypothetical protein
MMLQLGVVAFSFVWQAIDKLRRASTAKKCYRIFCRNASSTVPYRRMLL